MNATTLIIVKDEAESGIHLVPEHLRAGLMAHVMTGRPVGGFLTAVLSNDLLEAVNRADDQSFPALPKIMKFLYNYTPGPCWGSREKVDAWRKNGGSTGKEGNVDA